MLSSCRSSVNYRSIFFWEGSWKEFLQDHRCKVDQTPLHQRKVELVIAHSDSFRPKILRLAFCLEGIAFDSWLLIFSNWFWAMCFWSAVLMWPNLDEPKLCEHSCEYHMLSWAPRSHKLQYTHECSSRFCNQILCNLRSCPFVLKGSKVLRETSNTDSMFNVGD